ncbi:MAG: DUF3572 domain-containing protein [Pseudomonadota bacterium]
MTPEHATSISISALQYIAGDQEQLARFLSLTGLAADDIRALAETTDFLSAVLDYLLNDEPTLLAFAASSNLDPADVSKAKLTLNPVDHAEF